MNNKEVSKLCVLALSSFLAIGRAQATVLFTQPSLPGILNSDGSTNFFVPLAQGGVLAPAGQFSMTLWQQNPLPGSNGFTYPVSWDAGALTGFQGLPNPSAEQTGFNPNAPSTSTGQIYGTTVGAYLNSSDIAGLCANNANYCKFMMTPGMEFSTPTAPFQATVSALQFTFNIQIPTATNPTNVPQCLTYTAMDALFEVPNGQGNPPVKVTFNAGVFFNGHAWVQGVPVFNTSYDAPSKSYIMGVYLIPEASEYVTLMPDSSLSTGTPWTGFVKYDYKFTYQNFQNAINALAAAYPGTLPTTDPSQYSFVGFHLNAEMQISGCQTDAVELGWSMSDLLIKQF